ncbi:carboxypeptidase O [Grus japonensis]|uniref:Carboxypeptidase O n=1 Tax=Grus japonensis TaxID=30415 RepID=A0ABC9X376_GRUJA
MTRGDLVFSLHAAVNIGVPQNTLLVQTLVRVCQEKLNQLDNRCISVLATTLAGLDKDKNITSGTAHSKYQRHLYTAKPDEMPGKRCSSLSEKEIRENVHDAPFRQLILILEGCYNLQYRNVKLFSALADYVSSTACLWDKRQVVLFLSAFETLSFQPSELMGTFAEKVTEDPEFLNLKNLLIVLRVYSRLNYVPRNQKHLLAILFVPLSAFCVGTTHPQGKLAMKKRHLNKLGYHVILIYQWMTQIQKNNSELVTQHYLGKTIENRTMYYLQILQNYKSDPKISRFLQNLDLYILPVLNIDGYIYSWEKDRLWRKNRSSHMNGTCYGTDLNRNFNSSWGSIGVSYNCSSEIFCGSGPESEPETRAVAQLIERKKSDILCYLTIHSYGQYILTPYGSTTKPPSNSEELMHVAKQAAAALMGKHGTSYEVGSTSSILYSNSGSSRDWAHMIGIPFSYTFELRDKGTHGFVLPPDQIQPTCEETMLAVTTIIDYVDQKYFPDGAVTLTSGSLGLSLCLSIALTWTVS